MRCVAASIISHLLQQKLTNIFNVFLHLRRARGQHFPAVLYSGSYFLHFLPPFIKQDCQIYPHYTQWGSFLKNMKLTNSYSLERLIKTYICFNLWFSKFTPLEDEIFTLG